jgi:alpha-1,3-mannosyltransferase
MSVLLYLPGLLVILVKKHGIVGTLRHVAGIVLIQLFVGAPFLLENASAYLAGAFDLSRVFLYKWTVNWRFVSEDVFLDSRFAIGLLALHVLTLVAFGALKWTKTDGGPQAVIRRALQRPDMSPAILPVTADREWNARHYEDELTEFVQRLPRLCTRQI